MMPRAFGPKRPRSYKDSEGQQSIKGIYPSCRHRQEEPFNDTFIGSNHIELNLVDLKLAWLPCCLNISLAARVLNPSLPGMGSREMSILAPVRSSTLLPGKQRAPAEVSQELHSEPDQLTGLADQGRHQLGLCGTGLEICL